MGTGLNIQTVVNLVVEVEMCSIEKESTTLLPQNMAVNIAIVQHMKAILMEKLNAKYLQNLFFIRSHIPSLVSFRQNMKNIAILMSKKKKKKKKKKQDSAPKFSQQN